MYIVVFLEGVNIIFHVWPNQTIILIWIIWLVIRETYMLEMYKCMICRKAAGANNLVLHIPYPGPATCIQCV